MSSMLFHVAPTLLEISLVCGVLVSDTTLRFLPFSNLQKATNFNSKFALVTCATMIGYSIFTFGITQWRFTSLLHVSICSNMLKEQSFAKK